MKPLLTSTHHTEWFCNKDCSTGCTGRRTPSLESWTDDYGGDDGGDYGGDYDDGDDGGGGSDDENIKRKLIVVVMVYCMSHSFLGIPIVVMVMSIMVVMMMMKCHDKKLKTKLIMHLLEINGSPHSAISSDRHW